MALLESQIQNYTICPLPSSTCTFKSPVMMKFLYNLTNSVNRFKNSKRKLLFDKPFFSSYGGS